MGWQHPAPDFHVVFVDHDSMTVDHVDIWMAIEIIGDIYKGARQQQIVGIQVGHDRPAGFCKSLVDRISLAVILGGLPL